MKLSDFRGDYYALSGKASDVARQLCFAGIALIWIFKPEKGGLLAVPVQLHTPAALFVVALAFDLLQYVLGSAIWGVFSRYHEWHGKKPDDLLEAPGYFNWPANFCFWGKLTLVLFAYSGLFEYIYRLRVA